MPSPQQPTGYGLPPADGSAAIDSGIAGASARREHERRRSGRETRALKGHPVLGRVRLALSSAPAHERAWIRGAEGEERVAAAFARHLHDGTVVLHDRRIPGSRANIDHIVVAPTGVWVVDPKRYKGRLRVSAPLFGCETLTINGRDRSSLIDGLERQVGGFQ